MKMKIRLEFLICFFLFSTFLSSCSFMGEEKKNGVLLEIGDNVLKTEKLAEAGLRGLSKDDSMRIVNKYIQDWISENLLFEKARQNVDNIKELRDAADRYYRTLVINEYERQLVNEKLSKDVSEEEINLAMANHHQEFVLKEPLIKGLFIKVPANAPDLDLLKGKLRRFQPESLELIEKYSLQNAMVYEYFFDRWVGLNKLMDNIPYKMSNPNMYVRTHQHIEVTEGDYWYFLYFKEYILEGAMQPIEYARPKLMEMVVYQKRNLFFKSLEQQLYREAIDKKEIRFHEYQPE